MFRAFPSSVITMRSLLPTIAALMSREISNRTLVSSRERSLETHPGTWFGPWALAFPVGERTGSH